MFKEEYDRLRIGFESCLMRIMDGLASPSESLICAMKYALSGAGKRLRPVLLLAIYDHFLNAEYVNVASKTLKSPLMTSAPEVASKMGCNLLDEKVTSEEDFYTSEKSCSRAIGTLSANPGEFFGECDGACGQLSSAELLACAVEILHAYTLIHDDLPCMDDDDYRRGRPSCHKRFGEATALLAGDSLLNLAYELLFEAAQENSSIIRGAFEFSKLVSAAGLIGGQAAELDLQSRSNCENANNDSKLEAEILEIYKNKTAALFVGAAVLGGVAAGCDDAQLGVLRDFAWNFGFAFQLKDDISDMNSGSYACVFGKEKTKKLIAVYSEKALFAARQLNIPFLEQIIDFDKSL